MPSSKYPNQIDTSSELPVIRNNIEEVGSEVINSLRSAIIQIEKTLGLNPQGTVGNTVSTRLSVSLDSSGNLLKEALDKANVIYGQITNDNIASNAAIDESKLRLNIPTFVIQSQVSEMSVLVDSLISQIRELSSLYVAHVATAATNRHPATAISFAASNSSSPESFKGSEATISVGAILDKIIESHINFSGTTTATNNSHVASQIYYDNSIRPDIIPSINVQGALDDLASSADVLIKEYKNYNNSNGLVTTANFVETGTSFGKLIASNVSATIYKNISTSRISEIILGTPITAPDFQIKKGDLVSVEFNNISYELQIYDISYNTIDPSLIDSIFVFGSFSEDVSSNNVDIYYKKKTESEINSLSIAALYNINLTSSDSVIILNPSSSMIVSDGIKIGEITDSNRYILVGINNETQHTIDVYNPDYISIDSIVESMNREFNALLIPLSAYKVNKRSGGSEIVIASNVGSDTTYQVGIKISRSGFDGCIDSLGFSDFEDKIIYGRTGTFYEINGTKFFGLNKKLSSDVLSFTTGLTFTSGLNIIEYSGTEDFDFNDYAIKIGDYISILGDGYNLSLKITDVSSSRLTISSDQLPSGFSQSSTDGLEYVIYENILNFSSFEFEEVSSGFGSTIFEVFLNSDNQLFYNPILEFETPVAIDQAIINIVDFENPSNLTAATIQYSVSDDGYPEVYFDEDQKVKVIANNSEIFVKSTSTGLICRINVHDVNSFITYIASNSSSNIFFFSEADKFSSLVLGRVVYNNFSSTMSGGFNGFSSTSIKRTGTISDKDISDDFVSNQIDKKIDDLRASGVISGLEIYDAIGSNGGTYKFSLKAGVCYVAGKRFFIKKQESVETNIVVGTGGTDKIYIGVDRLGNVVFESCDINCNYPWSDSVICLLGSLEYSGITQIYDQRLFIDQIDLKLLNAITVSPQPGLGHFTDVVKALKYAKRFNQIFPKAGTPEVHLKSGEHIVSVDIETEVSKIQWLLSLISKIENNEQKNYFDQYIKNGLFIDFPVKISGEGSNTKLVLKEFVNFINYDGINIFGGNIIISGAGFNTSGTRTNISHSRVSEGNLELSNIKIRSDIINLENDSILFSGIKIIDPNNITLTQTEIDGPLLEKNSNCYHIFENVDAESLYVLEISDTVNKKGNLKINNCRFTNRLIFDTTVSFLENICYIDVSNTTIFDSSTVITNLDFENLEDIGQEKNITFFNTKNAFSPSTQNYDRLSNNLIVPGNVTVYDDFIYHTEKTKEETIWLYQHIIGMETYSRSVPIASNVLSGTPAFLLDVASGDTNEENRVKLDFISYNFLSAYRTIPTIRLQNSENLVVPLNLSNGQRLKEIVLYPGMDPVTPGTDWVILRIYKVSHRDDSAYEFPDFVASSGNLQKVTGKIFSWELDLLVDLEPDRFYVLQIINVSGIDTYYSKAVLKFKSKKLSELIGIA